MPINPIADINDDEKNQDKANTTNSGGVSSGTTPSTQISSGVSQTVTGAPSGQSASGGQTSAGSPATPGSGNFVNLNQYIEANKDQGQGIGAAVAQGVQKSANTGLQSLGQSQQEFGSAEKAAGVNPDDYTEQKISQTAQNAINNPSAVQQSDIDAFNTARTKSAALAAGSDTAPKALTDLNSYQSAVGQLNTAQQNAGLTGTESGRQELLREQFQRPNYSQGQNALDQLLTQNVPENKQRFENLRQNLLGQYGLASQENQAIQQAADTRNQTIQQANQANQNIQNVLMGQTDANGNPIPATPAPAATPGGGLNGVPTAGGGVIGSVPTPPAGVQYGVLTNYYNQLLNAPTTANTQQSTNLAQQKQTLTDYLTKQYGSAILGVPIAKLVDTIVTPNSNLGAANITNVMTPDQLKSLQTLNQLEGLTDTNINQIGTGTSAQVIDPNAVGQGKFDPSIQQNLAAGQTVLQQGAGVFQDNTKNFLNNLATPAIDEQTMGTQPFSHIYDFYNYGNTSQLQNLAYDIAVQRDAKNNFPNNADLQSEGTYYGRLFSSLTGALNSINQKEGTNITVPQSYINHAMDVARQGAAYYNSTPDARYHNYKNTQAGQDDITTAGIIIAYTNFLHDLQANPAIALGGSYNNAFNNAPQPGQPPPSGPTTTRTMGPGPQLRPGQFSL